MGLLENLTNTLKQGWNVAKEKGELGARMGRLRLELLRLEREREAMYARLGKAYHHNPADTVSFEPLLLEVNRLTQNIRDCESVLAQLLESGNEKPEKPDQNAEIIDFSEER